jgi:ribosomal protein S18 acetylase RimI-like enzyme
MMRIGNANHEAFSTRPRAHCRYPGHVPDPATIEFATADDLDEIRAMLREYAAWTGVDLCFQNFSQELAGLPGDYAPPDGALLVARTDAGLPPAESRGLPPATSRGSVGLVALRRRDADRCEMKRLYVRDAARGTGLGRRLAERIIAEARARGYREIWLDTLPVMQDAQRLYVRLGFRDIAPYYASPIQGTRFMALTLYS